MIDRVTARLFHFFVCVYTGHDGKDSQAGPLIDLGRWGTLGSIMGWLIAQKLKAALPTLVFPKREPLVRQWLHLVNTHSTRESSVHLLRERGSRRVWFSPLFIRNRMRNWSLATLLFTICAWGSRLEDLGYISQEQQLKSSVKGRRRNISGHYLSQHLALDSGISFCSSVRMHIPWLLSVFWQVLPSWESGLLFGNTLV